MATETIRDVHVASDDIDLHEVLSSYRDAVALSPSAMALRLGLAPHGLEGDSLCDESHKHATFFLRRQGRTAHSGPFSSGHTRRTGNPGGRHDDRAEHGQALAGQCLVHPPQG